MALTARQLDRLVETLASIYEDAELRLLEHIARQLTQGLDSPTWAMDKLRELQLLLARLRGDLASMAGRSAEEITKAILDAYNSGRAGALAELVKANMATTAARGASPIVDAAMRALLEETIGATLGTHVRILRSADDIYRQVVAKASGITLTGAVTRRQAAQKALDAFADAGVTGFTDRAGRQWDMRSYVEMAMRSASHRASVQGHLDQLQAHGHDLVMVSDHAQECEQCRPFEGKVLSISGLPRIDGVQVLCSVAEAYQRGYGHPGCVLGDTRVAAPSGVLASDSRWYEGEIVVIHTARGNELSITPNHPVLTTEGWVAAGLLRVGNRVVSHRGHHQRVSATRPDDELIEARIGDVHEALLEASPVPAVRMPAATEQFHGDGGTNGHVEVVWTHGLLQDAGGASGRNGRGDQSLLRGGVRLSHFLRGRPSSQLGGGDDAPRGGDMRGSDLGGTLGLGHALPLASLGQATVGSIPTTGQSLADGRLTDPESLGDVCLGHAVEVEPDALGQPGWIRALHVASLLDGASDAGVLEELLNEGGTGADAFGQNPGGLSSPVAADDVIFIERRSWSGHVYNLQTGGGWYTASQIVVHNCRHRFIAYFDGITEVPQGTADPKGDADRQRQRYLERGVRAWKRREAAALDPQAKAAARLKVREWQARLREHVAANDLQALPYRTSTRAAR